MIMYSYLILFAFLLSLFILINGQKSDDPELPAVSYTAGRNSKTTFDTQFSRGRCPERFYQLGDECLYFSIDGKIYSWKNADDVCARHIGNILQQQSASNPDQPNMQPTRGVRQLTLNTPEKTEILRAFYQQYNEQNFAIRLPYDYNILQRCNDEQDDKWPTYCTNTPYPNSTCFDAISNNANDMCIREVDCNQKYLRLACEFTLPGSPELTDSRFRHCSKIHGRNRRRLPMWAWIAIAISSAILLLIILGGIIAFISKSKKNDSTRKKKFLPEPPPRRDETIVRVPPRRIDPAAEPMLTQSAPSNTDYLQPRSLTIENTANA